jgi:subtilase family serine protease
MLSSRPAEAAVSHVSVPSGALAGLHDSGPAANATLLRLAIELEPHGNLDALAAQMVDPQSPQHRDILTAAQLNDRFGRPADGAALGQLLRSAGASNVEVTRNGLVVSAIVEADLASKIFATRFHTFTNGTRVVIAPVTALTVPAADVRDVRGAVAATTPRLNDVRAAYTGFRGDWYLPATFREMYDALPGGGDGARIAIIEDASDVFDLRDVDTFLHADGAPPGASLSLVSERSFAFKTNAQDCGRDDRGQEAALDVQAALTLAPRAQIVVSYDDVCSLGNDGTGALARALDLDPSVIVFPFAVGPVRATGVTATYGRLPLPFIEAIVRGIPIVVSSGDDGAYGYKEPGIDEPAVTWPCVLPVVVCAGGTQLGNRDTAVDEGPWNDALFAGGGGVSPEPRPAWQNAPSAFEFSPDFVKGRMVPDVSADASGHLRVFWHAYGIGGVGGTSESAALVGAQLAAINAAVAPERRLLTAGDLYALARSHPGAFRDVKLENDRRYLDNTLRPRRKPLPKDYRGLVPPPPPLVEGCRAIEPQGCTVKAGYDAVTGIGSLKEATAAADLR